MKKYLALFLTMAMSVTMLAGCGGDIGIRQYYEYNAVVYIRLGECIGILTSCHGETVPDTVDGAAVQFHIFRVPVDRLFYKLPATAVTDLLRQIDVKAFIIAGVCAVEK